MALVSAVHHIATATNDLDRFVSFYAEAFELDPLPGFPMDTPVGRIAFFDLGPVLLKLAPTANWGPFCGHWLLCEVSGRR